MSSDAYELIALTARYIFTALMLLIVLRAARGALIDSRRAARLRRLSPMTGLSGELLVLEGDQRARQGMRYPIIREGTIGSSRSADVRIRHSSVRRRHAYFELTEAGLRLRSHAGARIRSARGRIIRETTLADNDVFSVGGVKLVLILNTPDAPKRRPRPGTDPDRDDAPDSGDLFHVDGRPFPDPDLSPIFRPGPRTAPARPFERDELSPIFRADGWDESRMRRRQQEKSREPAINRSENVLRTHEDRRSEPAAPVRSIFEPEERSTPSEEPQPARTPFDEDAFRIPGFDEPEPTLADDLAGLFEDDWDSDEWDATEPPEGWDDTPDDYDPDSLFNTGSSRR